MEGKKEIGLYINIPFCKSKCYYCDFFSYSNKYNLAEEYVQCLQREMKHYALENKILSEHQLEGKYFIKTIYFGGGTPSILDEILIVNIMSTIKNLFEISEDCEITIEVNPGTSSLEKLKTYFDIGFNRLSIGLQAVQDELLQKIGRIHTYQQFENTYQQARKVRFSKY